MTLKNYSGLLITLMLSGCAASFAPITQERLSSQVSENVSGIEIEYHYNVLEESKNNTYAEKAKTQSLSIVAVKIRNSSDKEVSVQKNLFFYVGESEIRPIPATEALMSIKQAEAAYFLIYLPLMFLNAHHEDCYDRGYGENRCTEKFIPVGLFIGPILGVYNAARASNANKKMLKEIGGNDLVMKPVGPGETVSGYLLFRDMGNLRVKAKIRS